MGVTEGSVLLQRVEEESFRGSGIDAISSKSSTDWMKFRISPGDNVFLRLLILMLRTKGSYKASKEENKGMKKKKRKRS